MTENNSLPSIFGLTPTQIKFVLGKVFEEDPASFDYQASPKDKGALRGTWRQVDR